MLDPDQDPSSSSYTAMAPNNVLVLGAPKTGKITLAQFLSQDFDTSTVPRDSHSGLIYNCELSTRYFQVSLKLLVEEFPEERKEDYEVSDALKKWFAEFSKPDFAELRDALDGVVYCLSMDADTQSYDEQFETLSHIKDSLGEEAFFVVVGASQTDIDLSIAESIEDEAIVNGFEFVDATKNGTNEYNEKLGLARVKEIFEAHSWSDMDKSELADETYQSHKRGKMGDMTRALLDENENEESVKNEAEETFDFDLERLLQKLRIDKEKVATLAEKDKKDYVDKLVQEYLELI